MQSNPMIISKCTGDISTNTSKSTSETDRIGLGGGPWGGPTPSTRASPRLYCRPEVICTVKLEHGVLGSMGTHETCGDYGRLCGDLRREMKRLPLYDFRYSSPTFLGEDSRLLEFY